METKDKKTNQLDSISDVVKPEATSDESATKLEASTTVKPKSYEKKMKKEDVVKKEKPKEKKLKEELPPYVDAQAVQHLLDRPKVAHAQNHQIAHNEPVTIHSYLMFIYYYFSCKQLQFFCHIDVLAWLLFLDFMLPYKKIVVKLIFKN